MKIAVIIPTYNAGCEFEKLCKWVLAQSIIINEFIIIDSSSSDGTQDIAPNYATEFISIPQSEFDHGSTRTLAAKISNSDILIYLTQDIEIISKNTFSELLTCFDDAPNVAAVYGRQLPHINAGFFAKCLRGFNYPNDSFTKSFSDKSSLGIKVAQLSNPFTAYRAEKLIEIGYFKEGLIFGEDMYAGGKFLLAGYQLSYCSTAVIRHSHNYSLMTDFNRYFDLGVFLTCESWIEKDFGGPANDGFKYVKHELLKVFNEKKFHLLFEFVLRNFLKISGYKLGKLYRYLPKLIVLSFSMNKGWWKKRL